ncbi:hypothetical protein QTP86_002348 [Hemibagrus guttatus]|nr:hypothetical protein QTP86_002348 [Hemibagrus guttatus]
MPKSTHPERTSRSPCSLNKPASQKESKSFYCSQSSHQVYCCPERLSSALIGSRAAVNQPIGEGFLYHHTPPLDLQIGLFHQEQISFYVITSPANHIVLGLPWLQLHDPSISWKEGELVRWSRHCLHSCFLHTWPHPGLAMRVGQVKTLSANTLPEVYKDLGEVFSKEKATRLPPHHPWDCTIDMLPNAMPPKNRAYPLSLPESKAMEDYIDEALAFGFIHPSTSLAAAGFFFVEKKDGGLHPCIDFRGLNTLTVRYPYPLPLVPAALEQLQTMSATSRHFSLVCCKTSCM